MLRLQFTQRGCASLLHPFIFLVIRIHIHHPKGKLKKCLPSSNSRKSVLQSGPTVIENITRVVSSMAHTHLTYAMSRSRWTWEALEEREGMEVVLVCTWRQVSQIDVEVENAQVGTGL